MRSKNRANFVRESHPVVPGRAPLIHRPQGEHTYMRS